MKRLSVFAVLAVISFSALLWSCKKDNEISRGTKPKANWKDYALVYDDNSIGAMHNILLKGYHEEYGFNFDSIVTMDEFNLCCDRMCAIALEKGLIIDSTEFLIFRAYLNTFRDGLNLITANNDLRPLSELMPSVLNDIHNDNLKTGFENMQAAINLGNDSAIQVSMDNLANESDLTENEQRMVSAYLSGFTHSRSYWSDQNDNSAMVGGIAGADAAGIMRGYLVGYFHGLSGSTLSRFSALAGAVTSEKYRDRGYYV